MKFINDILRDIFVITFIILRLVNDNGHSVHDYFPVFTNDRT